VEALFALADKIEARFELAQSRVRGMTPSLLARAFAGKLVPQDPADEPAAVLLKRIRQKGPAASLRQGYGRQASAGPTRSTAHPEAEPPRAEGRRAGQEPRRR
jgi:type I restriction enzyme S subunit